MNSHADSVSHPGKDIDLRRDTLSQDTTLHEQLERLASLTPPLQRTAGNTVSQLREATATRSNNSCAVIDIATTDDRHHSFVLDENFPPPKFKMPTVNDHGAMPEDEYDMLSTCSSDDEGALTPSSASVHSHLADDTDSVPETVHSCAETDISNADTVSTDGMQSDLHMGGSFVDLGEIQQGVHEEENDHTTLAGMDSEMTIVPSTPTTGSTLSSVPYTSRDLFMDSDIHAPVYTKTAFAGLIASLNMKLFSITTILAVVMLLATPYLMIRAPPLDAQAELAMRKDALGLALDTFSNRTGLSKGVSVDNVLHYPTVTQISGKSTASAVVFPADVEVYVASPSQLFVSLPKSPESKRYPSRAYVGVFKDGRPLLNVNRTHLIDGVIHLALDPGEAHGFVNVNFILPYQPYSNQTIKVDLGSRLLQRLTYEKAASLVQQTVQRDVYEAHTAAKALQSRLLAHVQSASRFAVKGAESLRNATRTSAQTSVCRAQQKLNGMIKSSKSFANLTGNAMTSARFEAMQELTKVRCAALSAVSGLSSQIQRMSPTKASFVRPLVKARHNARALKARITKGKKQAPARDNQAPSLRVRVLEHVTTLRNRFQALTLASIHAAHAPALYERVSRRSETLREKLNAFGGESLRRVQHVLGQARTRAHKAANAKYVQKQASPLSKVATPKANYKAGRKEKTAKGPSNK